MRHSTFAVSIMCVLTGVGSLIATVTGSPTVPGLVMLVAGCGLLTGRAWGWWLSLFTVAGHFGFCAFAERTPWYLGSFRAFWCQWSLVSESRGGALVVCAIFGLALVALLIDPPWRWPRRAMDERQAG